MYTKVYKTNMLVKPQSNPVAKIKVVGVGGAGGNALNTMVEDQGILDVEFIAVNTDAQALANSKADYKIKIGENVTRGLGSGGNPELGKKSAEETVDQVHEHLAGSDMVFIAAGMGGGTGTGAAPIVGEVAKNLGALTIAVVVKPFHFEGQRRMEAALKGIEQLKDKVDTLIVVPNQRLLEIMDAGASFMDGMKKSDEVLLQAVKSIANLSTQTGLINVDFADVRSVMDDAGTAMMGIGSGTGEERAVKSAEMAIDSPLLEVKVDGATGVLFNVVGGKSMGLQEIDKAAQVIRDRISPDANFIFGARIDEALPEDELQVTVLATGFADDQEQTIASPNPYSARAAQLVNKRTQSQPASTQLPETDAAEADDTSSKRGNLFGMFGGEKEKDGDRLEDEPSYLRRS